MVVPAGSWDCRLVAALVASLWGLMVVFPGSGPVEPIHACGRREPFRPEDLIAADATISPDGIATFRVLCVLELDTYLGPTVGLIR